jgi:hypothetical protein
LAFAAWRSLSILLSSFIEFPRSDATKIGRGISGPAAEPIVSQIF